MSPHRPPRTLVLLVLLAGFAAAPATSFAQARHMGWDDSTDGHQDLAFDCNNPPAEATLVVSFIAPASDIFSITAKLDMCTLPDDLPPWWRFDDPEGCRYGLDEVTTNFAGGPATFPMAWTASTSIIKQLTYGYGWSTAMNRWEITIYNSNSTATPLVMGQEYYAFKMKFHTPAGACAGCATPACFVLNDLIVQTSSGAMQTVMTYENWVKWQGGQGNCPFVVPVLPQTWGAIKAAYR